MDCLRAISSMGAARTFRPAKRATAVNRKDIFEGGYEWDGQRYRNNTNFGRFY